ncbi:hypothetical protein BJ165DRAFT_1496471 [Panaeolus papilionaceus]|nr:hypothetical protein BJ165DRAFT_1496471 [Panaeolus papilionaceus]
MHHSLNNMNTANFWWFSFLFLVPKIQMITDIFTLELLQGFNNISFKRYLFWVSLCSCCAGNLQIYR